MNHRRRPNGCKCHPLSPFLWYLEDRPSIFRDMKKIAEQSAAQTRVVDRMRRQGQDISHISGLSESSRAQRITDFKQFTIFSRAVPSKSK